MLNFKQNVFFALAVSATASCTALAGSQPAWFDQAVESHYPEMVEMRHKLHQMPELGNQEYKTQEVIYEFLKKAGVDKVIKGYKGSPTAVIGVLNPTKGDTVGLRADIDGLPIKENTGLPYESKAKGQMWGKESFVSHMCGHDAHIAMLLAAAKILSEHKAEINRRVVFVFQPAEEGDSLENQMTAKTPKISGARRLVKDGLIEEFDIKHMFGMHVQTGSESGLLEIASGSAMNIGDAFEIKIE
ncbi:MAG: M20/M25/M40 family metallo-hydrolase, partial [Sutterellaceae bacterium]|nr:M20/M25/M40 family metallo-hydrolase [Sutterellaceae bacterium]